MKEDIAKSKLEETQFREIIMNK